MTTLNRAFSCQSKRETEYRKKPGNAEEDVHAGADCGEAAACIASLLKGRRARTPRSTHSRLKMYRGVTGSGL